MIMPSRTKETPVDKIMKALDKKVAERGKASAAVMDTTAEITKLVIDARRHDVSMAELARHVKRLDKNTRELVPVSRQMLDTMVAPIEKRREARTTRESRRRKPTEPAVADRLNVEALQ
jgi:hypothetical protein